MGEIILIEDVDVCVEIVEEITNSCSFIGLDLEGVNLGFGGKICTLQIAMPNNDYVYIFDLYKEPELMTAGGLYKIITSEDIIKVMQDCRNDNVNLQRSFKICLVNVFDVQIGYNVLQSTSPSHLIKTRFRYVSLNVICRYVGIPFNRTKINYAKDYAVWKRRPLSSFMLSYAASDASILVDLYCKMSTHFRSDYYYKKIFDKLCIERLRSGTSF